MAGGPPRASMAVLLDVSVVNPGVGLLHAVAQGRAGRPPQEPLDPRVVAVATVDPLGRAEVVFPPEPGAPDLLDKVVKAVDRYQLVAAQVQRLVDITVHDQVDTLDAVVDPHETPGLSAVPPDLDLGPAGQLRLDDFPTGRGGGLFTPTLPRSEGTTDVVEPRHTCLQAEILPEMRAHPLGEKLLPAVTILGHGRVGVRFLQWDDLLG